MEEDAIHIRGLRLWAHVGVLEKERRLGQWFNLDITLLFDLGKCAISDDISESVDYSLAIRNLQALSRKINCLTIEYFTEQVFECLEEHRVA